MERSLPPHQTKSIYWLFGKKVIFLFSQKRREGFKVKVLAPPASSGSLVLSCQTMLLAGDLINHWQKPLKTCATLPHRHFWHPHRITCCYQVSVCPSSFVTCHQRDPVTQCFEPNLIFSSFSLKKREPNSSHSFHSESWYEKKVGKKKSELHFVLVTSITLPSDGKVLFNWRRVFQTCANCEEHLSAGWKEINDIFPNIASQCSRSNVRNSSTISRVILF